MAFFPFRTGVSMQASLILSMPVVVKCRCRRINKIPNLVRMFDGMTPRNIFSVANQAATEA